ncbi:MAG TPA: GIY-YIG nuclease family protein [Steroidobacteraceae bacterium]|nr:GIY-YIG nuclease family protein [Steroidobacteraceae bacterium]
MKTWWLYLLECNGDRLYAGIAIDVAARFELHRTGKGARFTRANRPKTILAAQPFETRGDALRAEYALKQLKRAEKLQWAAQWRFLSETEDQIGRNTKRAKRSDEVMK